MQESKIYKYRLKLTKNKALRFISHLDWQNLILKIFRRCELELVLSQGFNKMPKVSYSPALPIFLESNCELVNFQVYKPLSDSFLEDFKKNSPKGIEVLSITPIEDKKEPKSLENYLQWARYEAIINQEKKSIYNLDKLRYIIDKCLSCQELLINKKTKKGLEKTINYRNSLKSFEIKDDNVLSFVLKVGQNEEIPALRADEFLKKIFPSISFLKIKRVEFFDSNLKVI